MRYATRTPRDVSCDRHGALGGARFHVYKPVRRSGGRQRRGQTSHAGRGQETQIARSLYQGPSIARGKILFARDCTECHGADGKSLVDVVANATDLTDPKALEERHVGRRRSIAAFATAPARQCRRSRIK